MNSSIVSRLATGLVVLVLSCDLWAAQLTQKQAGDALRVYYSDLYMALAGYELGDVPFERSTIVVRRNDSLMKIASDHQFPALDPYHLAAAIYENNLHAFRNGKAASLTAGVTLKLPSVEDIFVAQDRFEKIRVVGNALDFTSDENQMRSAARLPHGSIAAEVAAEEQVTPAGFRIISSGDNKGFLSGARSSSDATGSGPGDDAALVVDTYSKWIDSLTDSARAELNDRDEQSKRTGRAANGGSVAKDDRVVLDDELLLGESALEDNKTDSQTRVNLAAAMPKLPVTEPALTASVNDSAQVVPDVSASVANTEPKTFYLGLPRDEEPLSPEEAATDPLSNPVEWSFNQGATMGEVLNQLADYIGYELICAEETVRSTYERPLPAIQRNMSGVTAEKAFDILAGRGFQTVFDHVERKVWHQPNADSVPAQAVTTNKAVVAGSIDSKTMASGGNAPLAEAAMSDKAPLATVAKAVVSTDTAPGLKKQIARQPVQQVGEAGSNDEIYNEIVAATGVAALMKQFPADILSAAGRHADRCDSNAIDSMPDAAKLSGNVLNQLGQWTPASAARNLADWYSSDTGRKVSSLETMEIDDEQLQRYVIDSHRLPMIEQIYRSTVTGKGIAAIAIELDYAGWALSGCRQAAERTGDMQLLSKELLHGKGIKKKVGKLEQLLREDMVQSLGYQLASLSDTELNEYAEIAGRQYVDVFEQLQASLINAIGLESGDTAYTATAMRNY